MKAEVCANVLRAESVSNTYYHKLPLKYWKLPAVQLSDLPSPGYKPGEDVPWRGSVVLPSGSFCSVGEAELKPDVWIQIFEVRGMETWGSREAEGRKNPHLKPEPFHSKASAFLCGFQPCAV